MKQEIKKQIADFSDFMENTLIEKEKENKKLQNELSSALGQNRHLRDKLRICQEKLKDEITEEDHYLVDKIERLEEELQEANNLIEKYQKLGLGITAETAPHSVV